LIEHPYLQAHRQFAVEQTAYADDDDGYVGEDVPQTICPALLGCKHDTFGILTFTPGITVFAKPWAQTVQGLARPFGHGGLGAMRESPQAAATHVLAEGARILDEAWRVANDANGGGDHQKAHNQQEPPAVVYLPDRKFVENLVPERAEFVEIGAGQLVLHEHRADYAGHA